MQESVEATRDVWLERDQPKTANQFRSILPVERSTVWGEP